MTNTRPALNGTVRPLGRIVLVDDAVAADACAGLIGFEPEKIVHIREGSRFLGNVKPTPSDQIGDTVPHLPIHSVWFQNFRTSMRFET
jgi:uncharacterized protein (DUF362 family)